MAITALPTPPSRTDPTNFAMRADAFMSALPQFVIDANATAQAMNLNSTNDISVSGVLIGTGAKTFTVSSGKSFQPGMWLVIASTAAPSNNAVYGTITSYSGTTLVVNIFSFMGSGTIASWAISQSAPGAALSSLGAAASGANTDITSLGSLASINGGQLAGMRNRIINGDMRIWQRGTGFSGIGQAPIYTTDRFTAACNGGVVSVSQGGAPTGGYLALSINGAAGVTNVQAQTKLESLNVYDLGSGQITVSGYVFQSTGAAISSALLKVFRANAVDNFSAVTQEGTSYTLPSIPSATWTFFKATFSISSTASNGISITLESGTPVVAGQSFATTLWQCEKGSVATPFENRPVGLELALCQRYFEKSYATSVAPGTATTAGMIQAVAYSVNDFYGGGGSSFAAEKRASPTVVFFNSDTGGINTIRDRTAGVDAAGNTANASTRGFAATNSSLTANRLYSWQWSASAEL